MTLEDPGDPATLEARAREVVGFAAGGPEVVAGSAPTLELEGDSLVLLDAEDVSLLSLAQRLDIALVGTEWRLKAYNNGQQAVVSVLAETSISVRFGPDSISGSAGCNQFQAACEISGDTIAIGLPAATRKYCGEPDGVMEQEAAFLAVLSSAATFELQDDQLDLRTAEGARVAVFSKGESSAVQE